LKILNDLIYNENTRIVSIFKDYLIFDDITEFLRRFYRMEEMVDRLPKLYDFYTEIKVCPNYVTLEGARRYMFKNIERK
jgi:hypothetical protein